MKQLAKDIIDNLAKALDKGREVGIQESIYRLLGLTMTKFSEVVRFINTNHPDRRDGLLKSDLDKLDKDEAIFHNSVHDYYQDRPINTVEDETDWNEMELGEFVASYNIAYKTLRNTKENNNLIKLQNNRGFITKRKKRCIIRYFLKYENDEEYYRALCILFLPFRNERMEIHKEDVRELYKMNMDKIEENRKKFEKHTEMVEVIKELDANNEKLDELEEDET